VASLSLDARKWRWLLSTLCKSKPGTWVYKFCVRKRVGEKCKANNMSYFARISSPQTETIYILPNSKSSSKLNLLSIQSFTSCLLSMSSNMM
jgi:hypothetical protein